MMIESIIKRENINFVNYFDDLKIHAAFHRKFPCNIIHRKTECRKNTFSLEMIFNGEVNLILDDRKINLKSPCLFWIGDNTKYFQYELIPDISYDHYWIDFSGERGRRIYNSLCTAFPDSFVQLKYEKNIKSIFEYFTHKFQVARKPASTPEDIIKIEQIMSELITDINKSDYDSDDPYKIKKLAEQISNSPFEKYNLPELAEQANLSYVHFRYLFKNTIGMPLKQYILEQQMLTAGELLKSRQFRIGELADYCGFDDITAFTRAFKRFYGISPKEYKNREQ